MGRVLAAEHEAVQVKSTEGTSVVFLAIALSYIIAGVLMPAAHANRALSLRQSKRKDLKYNNKRLILYV